MSRTVPFIPVELQPDGSKLVLVQDLVRRIPRCDCCPDLRLRTCQDCPQPVLGDVTPLGLQVNADFSVGPLIDVRSVSDWEFVSSFKEQTCLDDATPFSDAPFPDDRPFVTPIGLSLTNHLVVAGGLPGGGIVTGRWIWRSSNTYRALEFPPGRPDRRGRVTILIYLHVLQISDIEDAGIVTALAYALQMSVPFAVPGFNVLNLNWFEHGMIPASEPCRPEIFPATLSIEVGAGQFNQPPQRVEIQIGRFPDA